MSTKPEKHRGEALPSPDHSLPVGIAPLADLNWDKKKAPNTNCIFFAVKTQPTAEEKWQGEKKLNTVGIATHFLI